MVSVQTAQSISTGVAAKKLDRLEALRGFAAVWVVFHHTLPDDWGFGGLPVGRVLRFGQEAVILFFLLSGFVISYAQVHTSNKSFRSYFWKRALRIYIPVLSVYALSYFVASGQAGQLVSLEPWQLLGNLLMLQDWSFARPNVIVDAYMGNGPLWSLSYEWWFYMLFFPLFTFFDRTVMRDRVVFAVAVSSALIFVNWPTFVPRLLMYLAIWWTGVVLADEYVRGRLMSWRPFVLPAASLATITGILIADTLIERGTGARMLFGVHPVLGVRHFLFALVALLSALCWHRLSWRGFNLVFQPFLLFAPISYGIYITHWFLMAKAQYLAFINHPVIEWFAYFAITIAVSWLIERVIYPAVKRSLMPMLNARQGPAVRTRGV